MNSVLKVLLAFVLALALPLQGFAAIAMLSCEQTPTGHAPLEVAVPSGDDHCAEPQDSEPDDNAASHGCAASACTAALFPMTLDVPTPPKAGPIPFVAQYVPDAELSTLERPPRIS